MLAVAQKSTACSRRGPLGALPLSRTKALIAPPELRDSFLLRAHPVWQKRRPLPIPRACAWARGSPRTLALLLRNGDTIAASELSHDSASVPRTRGDISIPCWHWPPTASACRHLLAAGAYVMQPMLHVRCPPCRREDNLCWTAVLQLQQRLFIEYVKNARRGENLMGYRSWKSNGCCCNCKLPSAAAVAAATRSTWRVRHQAASADRSAAVY